MNRRRSLWWFLPVVAWMAFIFRLSSRSTVPHAPILTDQAAAVVGHFLLYATLALLLANALSRSRTTTSIGTISIALTLAVLYGISDEVHQSFVPGRDPAMFDVFVDAAGAMVGCACFQPD